MLLSRPSIARLLAATATALALQACASLPPAGPVLGKDTDGPTITVSPAPPTKPGCTPATCKPDLPPPTKTCTISGPCHPPGL